MSEHNELTLKWGTLKGWHCASDKFKALLTEYFEIGSSASAMMQCDTARQKEILCELIDECDDPQGIYLDWDGEYISKDKAKEYVMEYGK